MSDLSQLDVALADAISALNVAATTQPDGASQAIADASDRLRKAQARVRAGDPSAVPSGASIARQIVDANGPRDPGNPIYQALEAMDQRRSAAELETGRIPLVSRATLRGLNESTPTVREQLLPTLLAKAALVPTLNTARGQSIPTWLDGTGTRVVPVFTDRELLDAWSASQGEQHPDAVSLLALSTAAKLASDSGASGIVINPLNENFRITAHDLNRNGEQGIAAGSTVSFGAPADLPLAIRDAIRAAALRAPSVSSVFVANLVDDSQSIRRVVVVDGTEPRALQQYANVLQSELPEGTNLDLLDARGGLGHAISSSLTPTFTRST